MKKRIAVLFIFLPFLSGCEKESIDPSSCFTIATIEDWTGLDGCGYLLKLDNGQYLEPVWRWGRCGTPPHPEGYEEDPLTSFHWADGQRVRVGFQYADDQASICMKGRKAIITCLEDLYPGRRE